MPAAKLRIAWNDAAAIDLQEIRSYIAERNPSAAARVATRLVSGTQLLAARPLIGRTGRVPGTREFVFADIPYNAIHCLHDDGVTLEILRIIHTARLWPQPD